MTRFPFETPRTIGEGWREANLWQPMPQRRDIATMCNTARLCVRIAIERACDGAKDALMLRSALYNRDHGLPLSSAHHAALEKHYRERIAAVDAAVRSEFLAGQLRLDRQLAKQHHGLQSHDREYLGETKDVMRMVCEQHGIPPLEPLFDIDPTIDIINWEPADPTKWAPRRFGWDEGGSNA